MSTDSIDAITVVVIDDIQEHLDGLVEALERDHPAISVSPWRPKPDEPSIEETFQKLLTAPVDLVATDHDLTQNGPGGLLGSTIASWCLERYVPVCDFSRKPPDKLPRERSFFEMRIAPDLSESERAAEIARLALGFAQTRRALAAREATGSLSLDLALVVGDQALADELAPYLMGVSVAHSQLLQQLRDDRSDGASAPDPLALRTFVVGHLLVNAVLEFPGPIFSVDHLLAYCSTGQESAGLLTEYFSDCVYKGPFSRASAYFLRSEVDAKLEVLARNHTDIPFDERRYRRDLLEVELGELAPHGCERCAGKQGGYWCPFTLRAVCLQDNCSVGSVSWVPRGATLCRVEYRYYQELEPLLGA